MDTDWTFSSCSWLWEDDITFRNECIDPQWTHEVDKAFENNPTTNFGNTDELNDIATVVPIKNTEDNKLDCGTSCDDGTETKSGKNVPLSRNASSITVRKDKKKLSATGATWGMPWTQEEHRRFLYGLAIYGKGRWKEIAKDCVMTRTNGQVASHAQKYFQRMGAYKKEGKRAIVSNPTSTSPEKKSSNEEKSMTRNKSNGSHNHPINLLSPALEPPVLPAYFSGVSFPPSSTHMVSKDGVSVNVMPKRGEVSPLMSDKEIKEHGTSMLPKVPFGFDSGAPFIWFI